MAYTAQPVGFLADTVQRIRDFTDDPTDTPKWLTDRLYPLIRQSYGKVFRDIFGATDHYPLVRFSVAVVAGTATYALPSNIGRLLRFSRQETTTGYMTDFIVPRDHLHPLGPGVRLEGNVLRFEPTPTSTETLTLEYIPNGQCAIHLGTFTQAASGLSTTSMPIALGPSEGYAAGRPYEYLGQLYRLLGTSGSVPTGYLVFPVQERPITGWTPSTGNVTVGPALDFNPASFSGTYTYEVVPYFWDVMSQAIALDVVRQVHTFEDRSSKRDPTRVLYLEELKSLRDYFNSLQARTPRRWEFQTPENTGLYMV